MICWTYWIWFTGCTPCFSGHKENCAHRKKKRRVSEWKYEGQMKKLIGDDWEAFKAKGKFQMKEDEDGDPMWQYNEVSCAKEVTTYIVQKDASQQLS